LILCLHRRRRALWARLVRAIGDGAEFTQPAGPTSQMYGFALGHEFVGAALAHLGFVTGRVQLGLRC